ncbi:MAG: DUF2357 domain-containing protein [Treponema sp.]|jgi:hypothetical protein|nr:DUF2357 domain-containing protein [Treponema sp.]
MECRIRLWLHYREQSMVAAGDIPLYPVADILAWEVADTVSLVSEGLYTCAAVLKDLQRPIRGLELFLNDEAIGYGIPQRTGAFQEQTVDIIFRKEYLNDLLPGDGEDRKEGKPFLLHYDLLQLSLKVQYDDRSQLYSSDYLLCLSRNAANAENVADIITYLAEFNDDTISAWMFSPNSGTAAPHAPIRETAGPRDASYKSLSSYIELITAIHTCYKENYPAFKSGAQHRIVKHDALQSYDQIKSITRTSLHWLYQNIGELVETGSVTAIQLEGKHYLPYRMRIEKTTKSFDIYENRVVVGFLVLVCNNVAAIAEKVRRELEEEYQVIHKLQWMEQEGLRAPIIGIKQLQAERNRTFLTALQELHVNLARQYAQYRDILCASDTPLPGIPKKTKIFQEVRPYRQVFEQILKWYHFGEFILAKETLIGNAKTLDKLFEYYCLCKLLTLLKAEGFTGTGEVSRCFGYHAQAYTPGGGREIANTYLLRRGALLLTLYYQPVISADRFENNISLYRTTTADGFYTPDFLFKLQSARSSRSSYLIFDAKYSSRKSIRQYYMDRAIIKYGCQLSDREEAGQAIKMVWLLQGRMDESGYIERYHNSPLAQQYQPALSYGILKVNTQEGSLAHLWHEIYPLMQALEAAAP